jgi:glycosyltransferase involved in cell wall biosynthesis
MKVLWFALNPCYALKKLSPQTVSGGWLLALNEHLVKLESIELHVCFYWPTALEPFEFHNTRYYPILKSKPKNLVDKVFKKLLNFNYDKEDTDSLLEIIKEIEPDIIHVHGTELNFGLVKQMVSIPVIVSIQGILSPLYNKYFSGIPEKYIKKVKKRSLIQSFNSINKSFYLNAEREKKILKPIDYVIGRTDWDRRVTKVLAPHSKYFVGNEILRDSFYNEKNKWNKSCFGIPLKLITTTSDVTYKGFELIVYVAKFLHELGIDIEWKIVGLNENSTITRAVKHYLRCDFNRIGIMFCGILNENKLVNLLSESDIYCQVSHIENSPNSLCEAMILGMPVVATNVGGTSSLLENKVEGILVQEGEPYEFAGAIIELLNDFKIAQTYAANARQKALERHSPSNVLEETINTYRAILPN